MSITFAGGDEKVAGGHVAGPLKAATSVKKYCLANKSDRGILPSSMFVRSVGDTHLSGFFMPNSSEGSDRTGSMSITFAHGDEKVAGGHVAGHVCMNIYGCYLEISTSKCYAHGTNSIRSSGTTGDEES
ncbi:hypothetical protein POM88_029411 [Heracleum sosnowskyi]|uniref:AT-hook motif nuclear-localized protein n=1 Tax=Heracleum sosnowskyi TaxID=360622 RepID=A0AAD8MIG1_9APIA|nr:hypothetical protein POM88_029411 [Heracleum sosnowskyi]